MLSHWHTVFACLAVPPRDGVADILPTGAGCVCFGAAVPQALHVPEPVAISSHPLCQDWPAFCANSHRPAYSGAASH